MSRLKLLFTVSAALLAVSTLTSAMAQSADLYYAPPPSPCGAAAPYYGGGYYNNGRGYCGASACGGVAYGPGSCGGAVAPYEPPTYYGRAAAYAAGGYGSCGGCRSVEIVRQTAVAAPIAPVGCSPCGGGGVVAPYAPAPYAGGYGYDRGGGAYSACAARFRSFDPATGTYLSYSGVRLLCPYLGE
jgi:hypothetical protein